MFVSAFVISASVWLIQNTQIYYALAFPLLWIIPGLAWFPLLPHKTLSRSERLLIALGLNFIITPILTLLLVYIPGPLLRQHLLGVLIVAVSLPLFLSIFVHRRYKTESLRTNEAERQTSLPNSQGRHAFWQEGWFWLAAAILIAAGLRLINIGYAEYQGDEAIIMLRAADVLEGFETALFQHKKGPLELLVVMATWSLTGISSEWMTRLPFAWASMLALIGVFLIGRRLDRSHAGGLATCLLAVEGYLVAFGRITQYQSVVLLFSILAFLCLLIYYQSRHPALLLLAAASMGVGFLAHYDIIFVLPAVLFLLGARLWQDRNQGWRMWAPVVAAGFIGIGLVALFYVPFFSSGYVDQTAAYIGRRIGSSIHNNLWTTFKLTLVYDSIYLVMILIMGVSLHLWVLASRFGNWAKAALIVLLVLGESALLRPNLWLFAGVSIAILPFILLFVGAFFAPRQRLELRAVWVWMAIPSLFYLFLVEEAYTHVHIFFTPWALLAAIGLIDLARRARDWSLRERRLGLATGGVIAFLALIYPIIMFVNHVPEYQRTFAETVPELIASNTLFGDFVRLTGYQVTPTTVAPGEYVTVTLLWEPIQPTSVAYKQFTHLFDGETMIGQLDGPPFCGISPTFEWQPDEQIVDSYRVPVRTEAPQGNVPLLIGLYDGTTLERLPVTNGEGELLGDTFHLTNVDVKQNS